MRTAARSILAPLSVLGALGAAGGELRLLPEPGQELKRTFVESTSWELQDLEMSAGGAGVDQDLVETLGRSELELACTDQLEDVSDGQVLELVRSVETARVDSSFEIPEAGLQFRTLCVSPLEGEPLRFEWDEEEELHTASLEGGVEEDLDLELVWMDLDLSGFLPGESVEVGDDWELSMEAVGRFLRPGGELFLRPEEVTKGSFQTVPTTAVLASSMANVGQSTDEFEGEAEAVLEELREDEGVAVIAFEIEVESEADHTERLALFVEIADDKEGTEVQESVYQTELVGKGTLLWDLELGRMRSVDFEGELVITADLVWNEDLFEQSLTLEASYEVAGSTRIKAAVELVE